MNNLRGYRIPIFGVLLVIFASLFLLPVFNNIYKQNQWPYMISTEGSEFSLSIYLENIDPEKKELTYRLTEIIPVVKAEFSESTCVASIYIIHAYGSSSPSELITRNISSLSSLAGYFWGPESVIFWRVQGDTDHQIVSKMEIDDICTPTLARGGNNPNKDSTINKELSLPIDFKSYEYPYDTVVIRIDTRLIEVTPPSDSPINLISPMILPKIEWSLNFPGWEIEEIPPSQQWITTSDVLQFQLLRPSIYRIITPVLLACLFIFICLIPAIKDIGAICQSGVGIIVSIWAIRQVIVPPEIQWTTIIDPTCMMLYIALAISVLIAILRLWIFTPAPISIPSTEFPDLPLQDGAIQIPPFPSPISPTTSPSPAQKSPVRAYTVLLFGLAILGLILRSVFNRSNDKNY